MSAKACCVAVGAFLKQDEDRLKVIRSLIVSSLLVCFIATAGCSGQVSAGPDVEHATRVTLAQLKESTKNESSFNWLGSDKDFHYFKTQQGYYRLPRKLELPQILKQYDRGQKPGTTIVKVLIDGDNIVYASEDRVKERESHLNASKP